MVPIATALLAPSAWVAELTTATALLSLIILGGGAAYVGGASIPTGAMRVAFWGALAMGLTAVVGKLFGGSI